ncbi:phytoene desaturase family protein [Lacinutrix himadriensis]|uniref:phytoene desaturase family protein n=1 Tax=Lacinutrix himadriensis TaxID=641549 RepID=UPI0006E1FFCF|nr:NAD(P)/FAD-dependent oxidoreductase [Lacinutrix himadriensis]
MIQSYKKKPELQENYDAIIIGSGIGSLATGALLAKQGQKVLLLERHYEPGGFTHTFKRRGYEWDVGIHYIGDMQHPKSILRKLFSYISDDNLQWADMGDVYDKIIIGDKEYDFVKGVTNFKNKMISYFPEEEKAITEYINTIFKASKTSKKFYLDKSLPPLLSKLIGGFMRKPYNKYSDQTTYDVLRNLTDNEELIKVLTGQYGDYGLAPKESSFVMHTAVAKHYFAGGSFPVGGSSQIVKTIVPVIAKAGGTLLISAEVDEVIIENNTAKGVKMKDGKSFYAKNIISGAGIMTTYNKLLPEDTVAKHHLKEQLQKVKRSVASTCLYIGLEGSPEELKLPKTNYWIYPEDLDHDASIARYLEDPDQPFPVVYISFPSAKDPDWPNRYPGKSAIDIITLMPSDTFNEWKGTNWKKRGEDYEQLKEKIAQRLLEALFKKLPHLREKVDCYELSTPLTTQHFVNYEEGEIYGLDHSPKRFRQKFLKPRTPIKNFYLTGQDIMTAGIGSALFSGVLTATALTKKNILKKVQAYKS